MPLPSLSSSFTFPTVHILSSPSSFFASPADMVHLCKDLGYLDKNSQLMSPFLYFPSTATSTATSTASVEIKALPMASCSLMDTITMLYLPIYYYCTHYHPNILQQCQKEGGKEESEHSFFEHFHAWFLSIHPNTAPSDLIDQTECKTWFNIQEDILVMKEGWEKDGWVLENKEHLLPSSMSHVSFS